MANTFNTIKNAPGIIAKAAAKMFYDELHFCKSIGQADASDFKGKNGYSAGDTILVSKPARYIPTQGNFDITSTIQDTKEEKVALTLDILSTVAMEGNSLEFAYERELKNYINTEVKNAVNAIAHDVEAQVLTQATRNIPNSVGTPGSTTFDVATVLSARTKMNKFLCPKDNNRFLLLDSEAGASAVNARKGLFQSSSEIEKQYKYGLVGMADGFKWLESEMLRNHSNGNDVTGVNCDGNAVEGASSIALQGFTTTTGTLTAGSVFTIAGVNAVHPITKEDLGVLQQFTVLPSDAGATTYTADGNGDITANIYPALYAASEGRKTITALPGNTDALTFVGTASNTSLQNIAFHRDAFRMVSVPLVLPKNEQIAAQETYKGFTVALVQSWDQIQRRMITRLDFLGGVVPVRPEWACRIQA